MVLANIQCIDGIEEKFDLGFGEVRSWTATGCGWNVWMVRIFWLAETRAVVCLVWWSWNLAVTVPDLALPGPRSFWGPEFPRSRRGRRRRWHCVSRGLLLCWESSGGQTLLRQLWPIYARISWLFCIFFWHLEQLVECFIYFVTKVKCSVINFVLSLMQVMSNRSRQPPLNHLWNLISRNGHKFFS